MSGCRLLFIGLFACSLGAHADTPRVDHYQGLAAETLAEALDHLAEYNARLASMIERGALTPADLNAIHQLTYTLENALERIGEEVAAIAETLEEVHVASEQAEALLAQERAAAYLQSSRPLIERR